MLSALVGGGDEVDGGGPQLPREEVVHGEPEVAIQI